MSGSVVRFVPKSITGGKRAIAAAMLGVSVLALGATAPVTPAFAQRAELGHIPASFADLAERVKPAVVSISVSTGGAPRVAQREERRGGNRQAPSIPGIPDELQDFFRNLPREFGGGGGSPSPRPSTALGSGFVISEDGYVVTNNHVIDKANTIQVAFDTGTGHDKYDAELVGTDPRTDIALLKIKNPSGKKFPFVRFAGKESRVGDWVLAVGNPFGLGGTVTAGIVSALARGISDGPYDYLQIDAAVNRGNSGGPTFNLEGDVIGVNTAIYSPSGGNVGIAFAVPAATASKVVDQLRKTGSVARGWLGVKIQNLDDDMAKTFNLPDTSGALIQEVVSNGPGQAAGLKSEDVVLAVNGAKIKDTKDLALKIAEFQPDTTVDVRVMRKDKEETIKVKLGRFPGSSDEIAKLEESKPATKQFSALGLSFKTAPTSRRSAAQASKEGVEVADVEDGSDAATKGISPGDIITHVNGENVSSADDIEAIVKRSGRSAVRLTVKSQNQTAVVAINLKKG